MSLRNGFGNDSHTVLLTSASEQKLSESPYIIDSSYSYPGGGHHCYVSGITTGDGSIHGVFERRDGVNRTWITTGTTAEENWVYLDCRDNLDDFSFGDGDFCIDFWIKLTAVPVASPTIIYGSNGVFINDNNFYAFGYTNEQGGFQSGFTFMVRESGSYNLILTHSTGMTNNNWYHIALSRHNGYIRMFWNGDYVTGTTYNNTMPNFNHS